MERTNGGQYKLLPENISNSTSLILLLSPTQPADMIGSRLLMAMARSCLKRAAETKLLKAFCQGLIKQPSNFTRMVQSLKEDLDYSTAQPLTTRVRILFGFKNIKLCSLQYIFLEFIRFRYTNNKKQGTWILHFPLSRE